MARLGLALFVAGCGSTIDTPGGVDGAAGAGSDLSANNGTDDGGLDSSVASDDGSVTSDANGAFDASGAFDGGGPADGGGSVDGNGSGALLGFTTIVTIVLENHDYKEVVGNTTDAPYLNSLINQYGLATNYKDSLTHPSLPNYLYMISGSTQGFTADATASQTTPIKGDNLGNQMQQAHIAWRSYQESMGTACTLSDPFGGNYATKHDPFLFFDNIQNGPNMLCADTNVDYGQFAGDLAAGTYQYMWITPNLVNDGHGGPFPIPFIDDPKADLKASDTWCMTEVQKIIDSTTFKAGGVLFITWDEAEGRNGDDPDQIPMIVISPKIKMPGMQLTTAQSHASYLATIEDLFNLPRLGAAQGAPTLLGFFQ